MLVDEEMKHRLEAAIRAANWLTVYGVMVITPGMSDENAKCVRRDFEDFKRAFTPKQTGKVESRINRK